MNTIGSCGCCGAKHSLLIQADVVFPGILPYLSEAQLNLCETGIDVPENPYTGNPAYHASISPSQVFNTNYILSPSRLLLGYGLKNRRYLVETITSHNKALSRTTGQLIEWDSRMVRRYNRWTGEAEDIEYENQFAQGGANFFADGIWAIDYGAPLEDVYNPLKGQHQGSILVNSVSETSLAYKRWCTIFDSGDSPLVSAPDYPADAFSFEWDCTRELSEPITYDDLLALYSEMEAHASFDLLKARASYLRSHPELIEPGYFFYALVSKRDSSGNYIDEDVMGLISNESKWFDSGNSATFNADHICIQRGHEGTGNIIQYLRLLRVIKYWPKDQYEVITSPSKINTTEYSIDDSGAIVPHVDNYSPQWTSDTGKVLVDKESSLDIGTGGLGLILIYPEKRFSSSVIDTGMRCLRRTQLDLSTPWYGFRAFKNNDSNACIHDTPSLAHDSTDRYLTKVTEHAYHVDWYSWELGEDGQYHRGATPYRTYDWSEFRSVTLNRYTGAETVSTWATGTKPADECLPKDLLDNSIETIEGLFPHSVAECTATSYAASLTKGTVLECTLDCDMCADGLNVWDGDLTHTRRETLSSPVTFAEAKALHDSLYDSELSEEKLLTDFNANSQTDCQMPSGRLVSCDSAGNPVTNFGIGWGLVPLQNMAGQYCIVDGDFLVSKTMVCELRPNEDHKITRTDVEANQTTCGDFTPDENNTVLVIRPTVRGTETVEGFASC